MKKIFYLLSIICFFFFLAAPRTHALSLSSIEYFEDGSYFEVYLLSDQDVFSENSTSSTRSTITKSKIGYYRNAAGTALWSVKITATFFYNGTNSSCTSYTPNATSYNSNWTIKSCTGSKSGNSATATAVATQHLSLGITKDFTKSITIACSPSGVVS